MGTNVDRRTQFESCAFALEQKITDIRSVLRVHHADTLFQRKVVCGIGENRKTVFEAEAHQKWTDGIRLGRMAQVVSS